MAWAGKYEIVKDEESLEQMLASGVPEDIAKKILNVNVIEISVNGDEITINREGGRTTKYTINQETEETYPNGKSAKNKTTLNGNVLKIEVTTEAGSWTREFTLVGSELTISSSSKPGVPVGKRIFKKV